MNRTYKPRNFRADSLELIDHARDICENYARQGFDLTLRQLYYQFVSQDLLVNTEKSYNRLGSVINDARLAGLIDWDHLVDRTRNLAGVTHYDSPADILDIATRAFRTDLWATQPRRVEVWIEKEALVGVIEGVCDANDVDFFACRGYVSQSEQWRAGRRLGACLQGGQAVTVLHLGDHDPSGMDMTRDIEDRLRQFIAVDWLTEEPTDWAAETETGTQRGIFEDAADHVLGHHSDDPRRGRQRINHRNVFEIRRIALNMDQIEEHDPPPNPAKLTDSRARDYIAEFGPSSWELDALDPNTIANLIRDEVQALRVDVLWDEAVEAEATQRRRLEDMVATLQDND
jgi:hypothetical protein